MAGLYELRSSSEADYDAIAEIWHRSGSLPGVGPDEMPTKVDLRHRIDVEEAGGWKITVAVRGDEIIGFVAIRSDESMLRELFVKPDFQGCGLGQALLQHAIAVMPEGFSLYTRTTNSKACPFYEKAGLVARHKDLHPRNGDPVICYAWVP